MEKFKLSNGKEFQLVNNCVMSYQVGKLGVNSDNEFVFIVDACFFHEHDAIDYVKSKKKETEFYQILDYFDRIFLHIE